jgi:hypothetical protein
MINVVQLIVNLLLIHQQMPNTFVVQVKERVVVINVNIELVWKFVYQVVVVLKMLIVLVLVLFVQLKIQITICQTTHYVMMLLKHVEME